MSKKLAVIVIAIVVAMAFGASAAFAGDAPDTITIKKSGDTRSAVTFPHAITHPRPKRRSRAVLNAMAMTRAHPPPRRLSTTHAGAATRKRARVPQSATIVIQSDDCEPVLAAYQDSVI